MPNIKQIELPSGNTYDIKDANALHTDDLKSTTKSTLEAASMGSDAGKQYAVGLDKNGDLSVNVPWTNTTYTGANGVSLSGTTFSNSGVRSISTGSSNGTISVNTNGTSANVAVKGLGNAAYTNITDTYSATGTTPTSGKAIKNAFDTIAPMIYQGTLGTGGTITTLPTASNGNKGYVYNVITAGTYDSKAAIVGDIFISNGSAWILVPSGDEPTGTVTSIATGVGLTGGTITTSGTIKTKLKSETASTLDSTAMGSTANRQYAVGVDKSGYLSVNIPWTDTNTKVTSVGNHYAPTKDDNAELSVDASSTTAATWDSTSLVTGVNLQRDAKGHIVGITVDSIKMPANPNTDTNTKVTQTATTTSADYEVLFSETADNTTRTEGARKNTNLKFNPSTGNLQATQLNGVTIGSSPKFTDNDTKNTAGSTDTSSKIFLIGATSQAANPQTYSHDTAYVGTDGCLYSGGTKVLTAHQDISGKVSKTGDTMSGDLLFSDSGTTTRQVQGKVGTNDYWRVAGGATASNAGWMEIATADDGTEPIYARQYSGVYTTIKNEVTLLDASGNSIFPHNVTVGGTTGATLQYNTTTQSLDFIFA
jgi:hypothetical protein